MTREPGRAPPRHAHGDLNSLAPHERLPDAYLTYEYIIRNAGLNEAPAGIKTAGKNINNLRYADDAILMAESKEELKIFLFFLEYALPGTFPPHALL